MTIWNEREVIKKLNEGWLLIGDVGADVPFGLIDPLSDSSEDVCSEIAVEIVRELHRKGVLMPAAVSGKKMMYWNNPH